MISVRTFMLCVVSVKKRLQTAEADSKWETEKWRQPPVNIIVPRRGRSNSWRHSCVCAHKHACTQTHTHTNACTHSQVCRIISEAVRLWINCQTPLWSQKSKDAGRGGGVFESFVSISEAHWQERTVTRGSERTQHNLWPPNVPVKPSPCFQHLLLRSLSSFISFHLNRKLQCLVASGNQISVWREKARRESSGFIVESRIIKKKKVLGWQRRNGLFLHSLVLRGAFWQEWQTIP